MRKIVCLTLCGLMLAAAPPRPAAAWTTPAPGGELRRDLMDAVRPHAAWLFGAPIVFVVDELRVAGPVAFAMITPVRPDGQRLTEGDLQPYVSEYDNPFGFGGESMQVLYELSGRTWVATHWVIGATDVWWSWEPYCWRWGPVIPEVC